MAGIEIYADVAADVRGKGLEAGRVVDRQTGMHLQADHHLGSILGEPLAGRAPEGAHLVFDLPSKEFVVVGRGRPAGKDAKPPAGGACRTPAHGDHALDAKRDCQIDRGAEAGLGILALGRVGMKQIAGGIDGRERKAVLVKFALQAVALGGLSDRGEIEMRARPRAPGADAEFDVADASLRAPGKHVAPGELGKRVRENADSHATAFLNAEVRSSISRRACSTVVCTGAWPKAAAWKARSSSRKASS